MADHNYLLTHICYTHLCHLLQLPTQREQKFCPVHLFVTSWYRCHGVQSRSLTGQGFKSPAAGIAACCQVTAESLFWNFTLLNKAALPKNSPTSNNWSMWAYKGLASLPQFRIALKDPLTSNLCAIRQSSIANCITAQLLFVGPSPASPISS